MGVTSSFYWPTSTEYLTFIQGYLGLWWVREENCLPDGCKESWTWVKLTVWQPFRISFALLLGKDELLWQARDWWQKMGLGILPEERGSSRTKQDPQCVCVCVCVCVCTEEIPQRYSRRTPSGILMSFASISCQVEQDRMPTLITCFYQGNACQRRQSSSRQAMTLMVAKSMTLRSARGQQRRRETMIKCSHISRTKA